jgi:ABC-type spermidine/putrescine transport system permease subunit I
MENFMLHFSFLLPKYTIQDFISNPMKISFNVVTFNELIKELSTEQMVVLRKIFSDYAVFYKRSLIISSAVIVITIGSAAAFNYFVSKEEKKELFQQRSFPYILGTRGPFMITMVTAFIAWMCLFSYNGSSVATRLIDLAMAKK